MMDTNHEHEFDGKKDRNFHQKPFDDNTDNLSQIDETSASLADKGVDNTGITPDENATDEKEETDAQINQDDDRDKGDSTQDWDAENNRTGRNK